MATTVRSAVTGTEFDISGIDFDKNGDMLLLMRLRSSRDAKLAWRRGALKYAAASLRAQKAMFLGLASISQAFEISAMVMDRLANSMSSQPAEDPVPESNDEFEDTVVEHMYDTDFGDTLRIVRSIVFADNPYKK